MEVRKNYDSNENLDVVINEAINEMAQKLNPLFLDTDVNTIKESYLNLNINSHYDDLHTMLADR